MIMNEILKDCFSFEKKVINAKKENKETSSIAEVLEKVPR